MNLIGIFYTLFWCLSNFIRVVHLFRDLQTPNCKKIWHICEIWKLPHKVSWMQAQSIPWLRFHTTHLKDLWVSIAPLFFLYWLEWPGHRLDCKRRLIRLSHSPPWCASEVAVLLFMAMTTCFLYILSFLLLSFPPPPPPPTHYSSSNNESQSYKFINA